MVPTMVPMQVVWPLFFWGHRLEDYRKSSLRHQDYLAAVTQDCRCWVRYHLATRTCVQFEGGGIKIVLVAVDGGLVTKKKMRSG